MSENATQALGREKSMPSLPTETIEPTRTGYQRVSLPGVSAYSAMLSNQTLAAAWTGNRYEQNISSTDGPGYRIPEKNLSLELILSVGNPMATKVYSHLV